MAARRGKSQAKRNSNQATPAWVWLILGLLIGAGVFFFFKKDGGDFSPYRPQPNPQAQPASTSAADEESVAPDAPAESGEKTGDGAGSEKETQYDFYTLLPGKEVQMSDAEVAASAREEDARKARAALENKPDPTAAANQPKPIPETATPAAAAIAAATTPTTASTAATTEPATTTVASNASGGRYILQAGAFGASTDAEATKAKIALAGLNARVESAQINGKTVYRVRMGPYSSATELSEAKQTLSASGLPAMAIKAQ